MPPDEYRSGVLGVEQRLRSIRIRIAHAADRAGRDPAAVTLIGATKTVEAAAIRDAFAAGLHDFGENRVQEAIDKIAVVGPGPQWHLIGHLQRNKAKAAARVFAMLQSIDSLKVAQAVDRAAHDLGRRVPFLIEVNVAGEPTKYGVPPDAVGEMFGALRECPHLEPVGLMTVAPLVDDPETVRPIFRALRELRDRLRDERAGGAFAELSMGMSGDFEVAIEEGATMVRIGRAIFAEH